MDSVTDRGNIVLAAELPLVEIAPESVRVLCEEEVQLYGQCGGDNFEGNTCCVAGAVCEVQNRFYSQCIEGYALLQLIVRDSRHSFDLDTPLCCSNEDLLMST